MTLVQLRHLISVAQTGSFSRSAEAMHLTQPALSRSVRALEQELGIPLFDRIGRHSELTAFGREMLGRARALVAEADELRDRGRQLREGAAGTVRVGLGSGPGAILMTPFLQHMTVHHPGVRTEVARGSTDLLVHSLRERLLDALVVDLRALRPPLTLRWTSCTKCAPPSCAAPTIHSPACSGICASRMCSATPSPPPR